MHQANATNPNYQFYQPPSTNSNPNPIPIDPHAHASAPPVSGYDHGYNSAWYPQSSNHVPNSNPTAPTDFHYPYDQNQAALNYAPPNPSLAPHLNSSYSNDPFASSTYAGEYSSRFNQEGYSDEGVYRYEGGNSEPYGARGTSGLKYASHTLFDDYGRPVNFSKGEDSGGPQIPTNLLKAATPSAEDVQSGVQKFRVKLLSEGFGQTDMDVLCQIGLDGIHMLDPANSRMLRIYSLDNVTKWEVLDSHIFAFWAKAAVDIEPKRIRLKSNSYTTNTILDIVTAASVQFKEMGDQKESDHRRTSEQQVERKKSFVDWMNLIKPANEEKEYWVPDEAVTNCTSCSVNFNAFVRKHHCRNCGEIFCDKCTQGRTPLTADEQAQPVRVCDRCMAEVTERLENTKDIASRNGGLHSHEYLAKRLKEEMNKNAKVSSGSPSNGSGRQMQEVECPTCTVHLQVQVPSSGSETIECSVCQHPFLVNAH